MSKELTTFFSIAHCMWYIYYPYLNYYNNQLFFAIKSAKKTTKKNNQNFLTNQIKNKCTNLNCEPNPTSKIGTTKRKRTKMCRLD